MVSGRKILQSSIHGVPQLRTQDCGILQLRSSELTNLWMEAKVQAAEGQGGRQEVDVLQVAMLVLERLGVMTELEWLEAARQELGRQELRRQEVGTLVEKQAVGMPVSRRLA